jgi:CheY-like chemotaxis protein
MPNTKTRLLIVDDEPSVRTSLSCVLNEIGYRVRTAEDGLSALAELRSEIPDILLSDLNMPGMSGFELLSVVRRRFPAMKTIAMSGMFRGDEVPSGLAADGFYQKGSSMSSLLRIMDALPQPERMAHNQSTTLEPILIQQTVDGDSGEVVVTISCPECLRSFSHTCSAANNIVCETQCMYCLGLIHFAIVQSPLQRGDRLTAQGFQRTRSRGNLQAAGQQQNSN